MSRDENNMVHLQNNAIDSDDEEEPYTKLIEPGVDMYWLIGDYRPM